MDAVEHRCCKEIGQVRQKLTFDGCVKLVKCITKHEDFHAMTKIMVLLQVEPLLRDKSGRGDGQIENQ